VVVPSAVASGISAIIGGPVVTVPLGSYPSGTRVVANRRGLVSVAPNIPFGISFAGGLWSEEVLVGIAYAFEQRTGVRGRVKPYVRPTVELGDVVG
jgi:amidase